MEFECPHCHARYSVPLNRVDRLPTMCPNCNERWVSETQTANDKLPEIAILRRFVGCLQEMKACSFGATLRFEIAPDTASVVGSKETK